MHAVSVSAEALCPATSIKILARQWTDEMRVPSRNGPDTLAQDLARAQAVRDHLRLPTGRDPMRYIRRRIHLVQPTLDDASGSMAVRTPTSGTIDGTYNVRVMVQGRTRSGCAFMRLGFQSVRVDDAES